MQRSDIWFRQRRGKLTASTLGQALGLTPWGSPASLAEQVRLDLAEQDDDKPTKRVCTGLRPNPALTWGTVQEASGLAEYTALTGRQVEATGFWQHADLEWMGGSPDGLVGDDGLVEIKAPYSKKLYETFPLHYYPQVNALLEITGRDWCDLLCWTPTGARMWRVQASKAHWDQLMPFYCNYWGCVVHGSEKPRKPPRIADLVDDMVSEAVREMPLPELSSPFPLMTSSEALAPQVHVAQAAAEADRVAGHQAEL